MPNTRNGAARTSVEDPTLITSWAAEVPAAMVVGDSSRTVLGVLPQFRKRGIAELMILRAFQHGKHKLGYTGAELGWTLEDNEMINRTVESVTHALDLTLDFGLEV